MAPATATLPVDPRGSVSVETGSVELTVVAAAGVELVDTLDVVAGIVVVAAVEPVGPDPIDNRPAGADNRPDEGPGVADGDGVVAVVTIAEGDTAAAGVAEVAEVDAVTGLAVVGEVPALNVDSAADAEDTAPSADVTGLAAAAGAVEEDAVVTIAEGDTAAAGVAEVAEVDAVTGLAVVGEVPALNVDSAADAEDTAPSADVTGLAAAAGAVEENAVVTIAEGDTAAAGVAEVVEVDAVTGLAVVGEVPALNVDPAADRETITDVTTAAAAGPVEENAVVTIAEGDTTAAGDDAVTGLAVVGEVPALNVDRRRTPRTQHRAPM